MPIYFTNDGARFLARDAEDLVRLLRQASRTPSRSDFEFMAQVAQRVALQTGHAIDFTSVTEFVDGLVEAGLIERSN